MIAVSAWAESFIESWAESFIESLEEHRQRKVYFTPTHGIKLQTQIILTKLRHDGAGRLYAKLPR